MSGTVSSAIEARLPSDTTNSGRVLFTARMKMCQFHATWRTPAITPKAASSPTAGSQRSPMTKCTRSPANRASPPPNPDDEVPEAPPNQGDPHAECHAPHDRQPVRLLERLVEQVAPVRHSAD